MNFSKFNDQVVAQLANMQKTNELFFVDVTRDELFEVYLSSFPEGTNPTYNTRTEHDCNCCKSFIRNIGHVVAIVNNQLVTIWDNVSEQPYDVVAKSLSDYVKSKQIAGVYRSEFAKIGNVKTTSIDKQGKVVQYDHFGCSISQKFVVNKNQSLAQFNGNALTNKQLLERAVTEISAQACKDVIELIEQNSIYRGQEHIATVNLALKTINEYQKIKTSLQQQYLWVKSGELKESSRFKNSVIGTLLVDISSGIDIEDAVKMFETKVAPHNYKRPTSLITPAMIKKAQQTVKDLDIEDSLHRRFAVMEDLTINNVLFADRSAKQTMGVFDQLISASSNKPPKDDKSQPITIKQFIETVLPKTNTVELLLDNKHMSNMVSLIAPVHTESAKILKWDNNFSWSYTGEVTDSIKERVKQAGGSVDGVLRTSLSWFNYDDLDIHVIEPGGEEICFHHKRSKMGGVLDVDMNAGYGKSRNPVENVTWKDDSNLKKGIYRVVVNNYCKRESSNVGFVVQMEYKGTQWEFNYESAVGNCRDVDVVQFSYDPKKGVEIVKSIDSTQTQKEFWNVTTNKWIKVDLLLNSPNHWDDNTQGNKHWFFILNGCKNPDSARGFYNEFLRDDLHQHRKVFEVLSSQMKCQPTDSQLSGVGFSSTIPNSVMCRVTGEINRIYQINF